MFIRTERLFLRPAFPEDWWEVYRGLNDAAVAQKLARAPWPYREQDARDFCMKQDQRGPLAFVVSLPGKQGAPVIGTIGLRRLADEPYEIGYWFARVHWGQGFATEAVRGLLRTARALGIEQIAAGHFLDNPASGRVLRKCGFRETGEIRPIPCAAGAGELRLARRYAAALVEAEGELDADMDAAA